MDSGSAIARDVIIIENLIYHIILYYCSYINSQSFRHDTRITLKKTVFRNDDCVESYTFWNDNEASEKQWAYFRYHAQNLSDRSCPRSSPISRTRGLILVFTEPSDQPRPPRWPSAVRRYEACLWLVILMNVLTIEPTSCTEHSKEDCFQVTPIFQKV